MRTLRAAVVLLAVLLLAALAFGKLTANNGRPVAATASFGRGLSHVAVGTSTKIHLSPDAQMVALVEGGAVTVVRTGDGSLVMSTGKNVVDAAWLPDGERVIVVEGPIPTGQIAAVDMRGKVVGIAKLNPSIEFGNGFGLAADSAGARAAAIAVRRDAIGGAVHTDLVVVDLRSGVSNTLATTTEERKPVFVDDDAVGAIVASSNGDDDFVVGSAQVSAFRKAAAHVIGGPFPASRSGEVVIEIDPAAPVLVALDPATGRQRVLARVRPGRDPVDVDARLTRALVRITDKDGTVHLGFDALSTRASTP